MAKVKSLITHWLSDSNLEFRAGGHRVVPINSESQTQAEPSPLAVGWMTGRSGTFTVGHFHGLTGS
jgi:hypothetical protein